VSRNTPDRGTLRADPRQRAARHTAPWPRFPSAICPWTPQHAGAQPDFGHASAQVRASPDKSPTRRLVIEATYDLQGHRPSTQCAACTIDLTTAGKGYAATGRRAELTRPGTRTRCGPRTTRSPRQQGHAHPCQGAGQQTPAPAPAPADIPTHPARQRRGPTPGRKNRRRYALITAARRPRVTRPLLPAPRALMQVAGPEQSRRRCGRFGQ
jgi:hypothetical protein